MNLLKGSWVLKMAAMVCALVTYFYINNEIRRLSAVSAPDPSYKLIKLTAKNLPVKVRLATSPPEGYQLLADKVTTNPSQVVVVGPEALLDEARSAETSLLDFSESTKTVTKKVPLESVAGIHLNGDSYLVEVTVPIEKIEPKTETKPEAAK